MYALTFSQSLIHLYANTCVNVPMPLFLIIGMICGGTYHTTGSSLLQIDTLNWYLNWVNSDLTQNNNRPI